jgi:hypothetical protein
LDLRTGDLLSNGAYGQLIAGEYWTMPGNAARLGCTSFNISKRNF